MTGITSTGMYCTDHKIKSISGKLTMIGNEDRKPLPIVMNSNRSRPEEQMITDTTNDIQRLVQRYAPSEMDDDTIEYLVAVLHEQGDTIDLVHMLGDVLDAGTASELAADIAKLKATNATVSVIPSSPKQRQATDRPLSPGFNEISDSSDNESSMHQSDKEDKKRAREVKKLERQRRKDAKKQELLKVAKLDDIKEDFVDDDISAWQEAQEKGQTWGGRGRGGRGVRGDVNSYTNIHLSNVTLQFAGNELLRSSTIQITGGHRYGLVGRNGVGKSTLLRRLSAHAIPGIPHDLRILLVNQQVDGGDETVLDHLLQADKNRVALLKEQEEIEAQLLEQGNNVNDLVTRLGEIFAELDLMESDLAEEKAIEILTGLKFSKSMMKAPTSALSGGWRMRLALAQALFVPCDLLLLDEPSNHLDLHALTWLTNYLKMSNHTVILVSHDRGFLDVCTDIILFEHQKLTYFSGSYSSYERRMEEKAAQQTQMLDANERRRTKAMAFIQKQQGMGDKKNADPNKQRQAKMMKEKKLERIGNYREDGHRYKNFSLAKLSEDYVRLAQKVHIEADEPVIKMTFPIPKYSPGMTTTGTSLIKMENLTFGYSADKPALLNELTLDLTRESKVALVGPNGAGKSTLLKLIIGELVSMNEIHETTCDLWRHPNLRVGHMTQYSIEELEEYKELTVLEYAEKTIIKRHASSHGGVRQYLGAFGLGGKLAHRQIGSLSGGERMRLCFATVLAEEPHLLVLDEPSNHLDMETLDSLSRALNNFQGAVIIVSHNQSFLSGFCKELWVIEDGKIDIRHSDTQTFDELFDGYRSEIMINSRSGKRQMKAAMAKQATKQKAGATTGTGFIP